MKTVTRNYYIYSAILFAVFLIIIFFSYVYSLLQLIETEIQNRPSWIDISLEETMQKKQNVSLLFKILHVLFGVLVPFYDSNTKLFCDWKQLETHLDDIVRRLNEKGIKVDHVVGIKSGGAIISKYVADKLNVEYSYVKVSNKEYKCNKKEEDFIKEAPSRWMNKKREYMVCEPIEEDLKGQNVLILDEQISSGVTMKTVIDYVKNEKKAKLVYPAVIANCTKKKYDYEILYNSVIRYSVWPWGYDN
jgi:hypoxanthine phosphoribosyltransferase